MTPRAVLIAAALVACGGTPPPAPVPGADLGWLGVAISQPEAVATRFAPDRLGWIALHAHDDRRAAWSSDPVVRTRASWRAAMLDADLSGVSGDAHARLFATWAERGPLPAGAAAMAAWSASCTGGDPEPWIARVADDDPGAPLIGWIRDGSHGETGPAAAAADHASAADKPDAFWGASTGPVLITNEADVERRWTDPCLFALATAAAERAAGGWDQVARDWAAGPTDAALLAPWLAPGDLADGSTVAAGTWGADAPARHGLGGGADLPGDGDDAQAARDESREVSDTLDRAVAAALVDATPSGTALATDLALAQHWRQQWHVARARQALAAGRPAQALAYADLGFDASQGIGPRNPAALAALRARALIHLGRTREALDALHLLAGRPGIRNLEEVVGDLAVLQGLGRAGDSKEN